MACVQHLRVSADGLCQLNSSFGLVCKWISSAIHWHQDGNFPQNTVFFYARQSLKYFAFLNLPLRWTDWSSTEKAMPLAQSSTVARRCQNIVAHFVATFTCSRVFFLEMKLDILWAALVWFSSRLSSVMTLWLASLRNSGLLFNSEVLYNLRNLSIAKS